MHPRPPTRLRAAGYGNRSVPATFVWIPNTKSLSKNRLREGDSPILLRRLSKIGTVPDGFANGKGKGRGKWGRGTDFWGLRHDFRKPTGRNPFAAKEVCVANRVNDNWPKSNRLE